MTKRLLNLGCGDRFHPEWENVDYAPASAKVRAHDLRSGIPYPDGNFDVVYHSHVLEHFSRRAGVQFLRECHRVLRSGGILRIAVPDLESIARLYLEWLQKAQRGAAGARENYEWMMLELYDQTVREKSCGGFVDYFWQNPFPNWEFVVSRWGSQAISFQKVFGNAPGHAENGAGQPSIAWRYVLRNPGRVLRDKLLRFVLGEPDWLALQLGRFRRSGEVHLWMYDSFSLGELLQLTGFAHPRRFSATESQIPGWNGFHLDSEPDGSTYKPDSLFMEAVKP